jgi:hypothetical protein
MTDAAGSAADRDGDDRECRHRVRWPPVRRRLLNLLTILSLLLCVAVLALWVRSHFVYEQVGRSTPGRGADVVRSAAGRLHFARHSYWDRTFGVGGRWERHVRVQTTDGWPRNEYQQPDDETLGFARYVGTGLVWPGQTLLAGNPLPPANYPGWRRDNYRVWVVPHGFLAAVMAALPVRWLQRHGPYVWNLRARRRRMAGLCPRCGYDLRATPDRCPECGAAATTPA